MSKPKHVPEMLKSIVKLSPRLDQCFGARHLQSKPNHLFALAMPQNVSCQSLLKIVHI